MTDAASHAARQGALLVREPDRRVLAVTGPDRATWLNGVVTCDVSTVGPRQAAFGLLLSKVGKIHTDFYVLSSPEALLLACAPGTFDLTLTELERMLVMEDAELGRPPGELVCWFLHGPRGAELAQTVERAGVVSGALDLSGLGGAVLLVPATEADAAAGELVRQGAVLADPEAWQTLRVERGIGIFGIDYGAADNPHEAGLDRRAVSWNKGCYLGQEVVFMQDARGKLKRRLVELGVEGPAPAAGTAVLTPGGEAVGEVTSSARSSVAPGSLALARVKAPHFEPGARLVVGAASATVRSEPV
ncbi:MAG TPA: glycine cleavage T C-terminal barrel domain-containing protein [Polyangiaceae bacterium]|nr:glycine cleavage T C-terminal barrel domain-containing protein [Polyangiaceae bacterium]